MKLRTRTDLPTLPGLAGTLRVGRPTRSLLARLRAGDIAVVDHVDLDRATAQRMIDDHKGTSGQLSLEGRR